MVANEKEVKDSKLSARSVSYNLLMDLDAYGEEERCFWRDR